MAKRWSEIEASHAADVDWGMDEPPPVRAAPEGDATERRKAHEKEAGRRPGLTERDYADRGFHRIGRGDPGQQEMFPHGTVAQDPTRSPHVQTMSDLSPADRRKLTQTMSARFGVTMQSATKEHGHLLDRAFRRSAAANPEAKEIKAEGQEWYHGGRGSEAEAVTAFGRTHGISRQAAASMRAVVSPQASAYEELGGAHAAATHVLAHPESKYEHGAYPGEKRFITGSRLVQQNIQKSAEIFRHAQAGVHPHEVEVEATGRRERRGEAALETTGPRKGQPKTGPALSGPKVVGYEESMSFPRTARRGAMDRHAVKGMAPHLSMAEVNSMLNVRHAHVFFSEAADRAAKQRGLGLAEGQTVAWHEKRNYENVPVEHGHGLHNPDQFEAVPAARMRRLPKQPETLAPKEAERRRATEKVRPQKPLF